MLQNGPMMLDEIKFAWGALGGLGLGGVVACVVAWIILKFYVPGYLGEKGKNLATKEDIAEITEIVEAVKHQNSELLEERKAHNQLRLAAVDRRLVAHQEAFTHWSTLQQVATGGHLMLDSEVNEISRTLRAWWHSNALFLEPDVRLRFDHALITAMRLPPMLKMNAQGGSPDASLQAIEIAQSTIRDLGGAIIRAVELPPLAGKEGARYAYMDVQLGPIVGQASAT